MWQNLNDPVTLGLLGPIGWQELVLVAIVGVLIFGKRLPEVGKSIGRGIVEFKRGLSGIEDDIDQAAQQPPQIERHEAGQMDMSSGQRTTQASPPSGGNQAQHSA